MATYHIDGISGNDGNSGADRANAWKTIAKIFSHGIATGDKYVFWRGYFNEGSIGGLAYGRTDVSFTGIGQVVFDGGGTHNYLFADSGGCYRWVFSGITIKNYLLGAPQHPTFSGFCGPYYPGSGIDNCTLLWTGALKKTVHPFPAGDNGMGIYNSTIFSAAITNWERPRCMYNCILYNCDEGLGYNPCADGSNYNATKDNTTFRGASGWDTDTYAPPFTSIVDLDNPNLMFDAGATHYARYRTLGRYADQVGASWTGAIKLNSDLVGIRPDDHPIMAMENDPRWCSAGGVPGVDGPADAAPFVFDGSHRGVIDLATVPGGMSARAISQVLDMGASYSLKGQIVSAIETATSKIDASKLAGTHTIEVRGHSVPFLKGDVPGSTDIDWTVFERGIIPALAAKRCWQWRETLRMDGVA